MSKRQKVQYSGMGGEPAFLAAFKKRVGYQEPEEDKDMEAKKAKLMKDFEKWAKQCGALEISFSTTAYGEDPRYEAFCTRLGYEPCGRNWKRRL